MSDNIKVAIKSRPLISREKSEDLVPLWMIKDKSIYQIDEFGNRYGDLYTFDHIFTDSSTNEEVYKEVVQYMVHSCMDGFNTTIFTYGQTSSGKTHTMMGSKQNTGIIQLAVNDIFSTSCNRTDRTYLIRCSYIEIYNEKINDLLEKNNQALNIREDLSGNNYINAREVIVSTSSEVIDVMKQGNKIRKIGITNMNDRSSRSHTIFRITIESREPSVENGPLQISQLNLVDLAGSERVAQTKAAGVRLKEGVNINKSLSVLGNVIRQLSEGERFVNYRDSKLTRLLQQALGGNAKALIITTITVAAGEETKSSLEFAQRAKLIKNKPEVNVMRSQEAQLKEYKVLIQKYEKRLKNAEDKLKGMETQKADWENEIVQLKSEALLLDRFRMGQAEQKTEKEKLKRRHTMGSFSSGTSSTARDSQLSKNLNELEGLEEDVFSHKNTYGFLKTILEENLEDVLPVSPEPDYQSDTEHRDSQFLIPEPKTSCAKECSEYQTLKLETESLRSHVNLLEQSYSQLREFTTREKGWEEELQKELEKLKNENKLLNKQLSGEQSQRIKEKQSIDKSKLQNDVLSLNKELDVLKKTKENMSIDIKYLNDLLKEERLKHEPMKAKFEEDILSLQKEVQLYKNKSSELGFALEQANTEKNLLELKLERTNQDQKFLLEDKDLKHKNEIEFLRKEIDSLNAQFSKDTSLECEKIRKELELTKQHMNSLIDDRDQLIKECKKHNAIVDQYDEQIFILHDQITMLEKEKFDNDVLRVATQTEDLDTLADELDKLKYLLETTQLRLLEETDENMREKTAFQEVLKQKSFLIDKIKIQINNLDSNIQPNIKILEENKKLQTENNVMNVRLSEQLKIIHKLETEIAELQDLSHKRNLIITENSNVITKFENKIKILEMVLEANHLDSTEKLTIIGELEDKVMNLQNLNDECNLSLEDKSKLISDYENKINNLEKLNNENILVFAEQSETIIQLRNKIKYLENINNENNLDLTEKSNLIFELKDQISKLAEKSGKIVNLQNKITCLENINQDNNRSLAEKSKLIDDLQSNIKTLENINNEKISKLADHDRSLAEKSEIILELKININNLEVINTENKLILAKKSDTILELQNKMEVLENINVKINLDLSDKVKRICELENKIITLEILNTQNKADLDEKSKVILAMKDELSEKSDEIINLHNKLRNLEMIYNENNVDLIEKSKVVIELKNQINNLEKSCEMRDLQNKIEDLENINYDAKLNLAEKSKMIVELDNNVESLENINNQNSFKIREQSEIIHQLENQIKNLEILRNLTVSEYAEIIEDLKKKINNLEITNNKCDVELTENLNIFVEVYNQIFDLTRKSNEIIDLENRIEELETVNIDNNLLLSEIEKTISNFENRTKENNFKLTEKSETILELENELKSLENSGNNFSLTDRLDAILNLSSKIRNLEVLNHKNNCIMIKKMKKVVELKSKIKNLETVNDKNNLIITEKSRMIIELESKIEDLEQLNNLNNLGLALATTSKRSDDHKIKVMDLENSNPEKDHNLVEQLPRQLHVTEVKLKQSKLLDTLSVSPIVVEDLQIPNLSLSKKHELLQKKDLKMLDPEKSTMEPCPSLVMLLGSNTPTNLSPRELTKLKRQSIHDQKRFSQDSQGSDSDTKISDHDLNSSREELVKQKKKIQELSNKVEHLEMVNHTLNDEVEYFMDESKELKERLMSLKDSENYSKMQGFLKKLLDIQKDLHSRNIPDGGDEKIKTLISLLEQLCDDISEGFMKTQSTIKDLEKKVEEYEETIKSTQLELTDVQYKLKRQITISKTLKEDNFNLKQKIKIKKQNAEIHIQNLKHKKEQIEKLQSLIQDLELKYQQKVPEECIGCRDNQKTIANWEKISMEKTRETVELQTKFFDIKNQIDDERKEHDQIVKLLNERIQCFELIAKAADEKKVSVDVQCNLANVELEGKYINIRRLAEMRKLENDKLKRQLGLKPDSAVP